MSSGPGLPHDDVRGDGPGRHVSPLCPDCRSADVRPSRSSYPLDKEKIASGGQGFWRCRNCGDRFVGPLAPGRPHSSRPGHDPVRREIDNQRRTRRWLSPLIVVITTIVVIILVLLMRESPLGLGVLDPE